MLPAATPPLTRNDWAAPAALAGLFAVVFGTAVINSVRLAAGEPVAHPATWGDQVAAVEGAIFGAVVVLVVVCRWLPRHAPDIVAAMGLRRLPIGPTASAALVYLAIAAASTWIGSQVSDAAAADDPFPAGVGGRVVGVAAGVSAGITEEIVLLALAAAVVARVLRDRPRLIVPVTLAVLIALRWSIHLQYGSASVFVLIWIPAAYALFRRIGSVWPLVIGHAAYDIAMVLKH